MATPYERVATAPVAVSARPPLVRPVSGRWLGGVCAGVATHLQLPVAAVRWATVALIVFGPGLPAYLFLWALVPSGSAGANAASTPAVAPDAAAAPVVGAASIDHGLARLTSGRAGTVVTVGFIVVGLVAVVLLQTSGVDARAGLLAPLLIVAAGAVVVWSDLDLADRGRAVGVGGVGGVGKVGGVSRGWLLLRLGLGGVLVVVGLVTLVTRGASVGVAVDALLATLALLAGLVLLAAPWALRLWTRRQAEQDAAARALERADIAAHLHDSVLQTLALIQRRSADPVAVTQLARAQERELRSWLYAGPTGSDETLAAAVAGAAHEIEDLHGIPVELVVTGDRPLEAHGQALTMALREALSNAVRHGKPPVSVYVEIGTTGVEAFVRDRGEGFDLDAVPADRLGVRHSVLERMLRHGGTARIRRRDDGTEVELTLPPLTGDTDDATD